MGVKGARHLDLPRGGCCQSEYIVQNMAADARFSTGQLYNPATSSTHPPLPLSLALVPRLIGMNIHYSMIFLEHPHTSMRKETSPFAEDR